MKCVLTCLPLVLGLGWFGIDRAATGMAPPTSTCEVSVERLDANTCRIVCTGPTGQVCEQIVECDEPCDTVCPEPRAACTQTSE